LGPKFRAVDKEMSQLAPDSDTPGDVSLLELPARIAALGIKTLEICHFHLPRLDQGYIRELRAALNEAGVELFSILIDAGDVTQSNPTRRTEELAWIRSWLEIAGRCGASHARAIAGYAGVEPEAGSLSDHPLIRLSAENLRTLARFGREHGVQVITENFHALTERPEALLAILDMCQGEVGLCVDFGNYKGTTKYQDLAAILPRADSIHAKAHYPQAGEMARADFVRCLNLARQANFAGPYSLIFDGPGDEWGSLVQMEQVVQPYL
jgi:sugar phosphate isomerase/epimerase